MYWCSTSFFYKFNQILTQARKNIQIQQIFVAVTHVCRVECFFCGFAVLSIIYVRQTNVQRGPIT